MGLDQVERRRDGKMDTAIEALANAAAVTFRNSSLETDFIAKMKQYRCGRSLDRHLSDRSLLTLRAF